MVTSRCWYFDQDTGEPLPPHYGCPVHRCDFIHPDSPQWRNAPKSSRSQRRRSSERSPAASTSSHNSSMKRGDFTRRRQSDWPSQDRALPTGPKGSYFKRDDGGNQDDPFKFTRGQAGGADWARKSSWGETSNSKSSGRGEPTRGQRSGWGEPSDGQWSGWGEPSTSTTSWGVRPSGSQAKLPPPPSAPPPPPPPFLATEALVPVELSRRNQAEDLLPMSERKKESRVSRAVVSKPSSRKSYLYKITLLSDAIVLHNELAQITHKLDARRKMQNTSRYTHVSESVQSKLDAFTREYEDKGKELKSKLDGVISKLISADAWPADATDHMGPSTDQDMSHGLSEIQIRLEKLEDAVTTKLGQLELEADRRKSKSHSPEQNDSRLLVEQKRPQESKLDGLAEDILMRLERMEVHLADIDNEITQQTGNVLEIVDARMEERFQGLRLGGSVLEDIEMVEPSTASRSQAKPHSVGDDLPDQIARLSHDHEDFANETATLITTNADNTLSIQRLQTRCADFEKTVEENRLTISDLQESSARNSRQIEALIAAVKTIHEQPSQVSNHFTDAGALMEPMRKRILHDVIGGVNATLMAFREQCEAAMLSSREETLAQVASYFGRTVDLVDIIYGYFSRSLQRENGIPSAT